MTKKRKKAREKFLKAVKKAKMVGRVVFTHWLPRKTTWVRESPQIMRHFFGVYSNLDKKTWIFSDGGGGFKEKKISVFESLGFMNRCIYPSAVHQYLSPNDNNFHGVAKAKWRSEIGDREIRSEDTLSLLKQCDAIEGQTVRDWFIRNFLLHNDKPTIKDCKDIIAESPKKKSRLHEEFHDEYLEWKEENAQMVEVEDD